MNDVSAYLDDQVFARLRQDFLADARDRLGTMEAAAGEAEADGEHALVTVRREAHNLKGLGTSLGFPAITVIAHRLEDFAAEIPTLSGRHAADALKFIDCMRGIIDQGEDPGDPRGSAKSCAPCQPMRRPSSRSAKAGRSRSFWSYRRKPCAAC